MSGLLYPPGVRFVFADLGDERGDPRFLIPLLEAERQGLQYRRVRPGRDLERPSLPIPWIVMVDDRDPGASGPNSFDPVTLRWLFADAFKIVVDAAEPHMGMYEYIVEEGLKRQRILIIQTVESRLKAWREFSQQNCELYGILELVPVTNNPKQRLSASVTRFDRG